MVYLESITSCWVVAPVVHTTYNNTIRFQRTDHSAEYSGFVNRVTECREIVIMASTISQKPSWREIGGDAVMVKSHAVPVPLREDIMGKGEGEVRSLPLIDVADSEVHKATARPNFANNKSGTQFRAT